MSAATLPLPAPFLAQMQALLGPELSAFLEALSSPAPTSIHFNVFKNFTLKENYEGVKWWNKGVYLPERPSFTLDPGFHAGGYYVQEASSMLVAAAVQALLDLSQPLRVLDLCAAPGGKSTLLASLLSEESLLVANEVIRSRYQILDYNLTKWGRANKLTTSQEVDKFKGLKDYFDLILVDAPCSGEGLFRKDTQAIAEWSPQNVVQCSARQKNILSDTVDLLKPGGILLYSTCTYNEQENDANAAWLLQQYPLEAAALRFSPEWGLQYRAVGFQCYPHLVQGEGFYLAAFRKTGAAAGGKKNKPARSLPYFEPLSKNQVERLGNWVDPNRELLLLQSEKNGVVAIPEKIHEAVLQLSPYIRYFRMGTAVGTFKGKDLIPDPALALSTIVHPDLSTVSIDLETALRYLKKESPDISAPLGWQLLQYQGLNLGWIKTLPNRINNYYPKEWKIRMQI